MPIHLAGLERSRLTPQPAPLRQARRLIDRACPIARSVSPASERASARSRRSSERGRAIHAGLQLQQKLESHLAIFGNPDCTKRQCALKQKVVSRLAAIGVLEDAAAGFCERICALATSLGAD